MDLPEFNFPLNFCQHLTEEGNKRRNFAGYGSYSQVGCHPCFSGDSDFDSSKCIPQKGMGTIDGIQQNIPPLPLFECSLQSSDDCQDHILGVDQFDEAMEAIKFTIKGATSLTRASCLKKGDNWLSEVEKLVDACLNEPDNSQHLKYLQEQLPFWMISMLNKSSKLSTAFNNDNCFQGFNREFYQGLLCHLQTSSSTRLFHAAGPTFSDIHMTEVSTSIGSLRCGEAMAFISLNEPVFQLKCSEKGLISARHKTTFSILSSAENPDDYPLHNIGTSSLNGKELSDVEFSPYIDEEIIACAKTGDVYLCNSLSSHQTLLTNCVDSSNLNENSWSSCYFAGHPRQVVVSHCDSMDMFDHRDNFSKGCRLFSLSKSFMKDYERIMASTYLGFPYHLAATDLTLFLLDQRFPTSPILQWNSEFITAPQLLKTCKSQLNDGRDESDVLIFAGSQQPAEVVCFPLHLAKRCPPVTRIFPWSVGKIGDFYDNQFTSYKPEWREMDNYFKTSLAGLTVVNESRCDNNTVSVYQMDSYGDIYFQNFSLRKSYSDQGNYLLMPPSSEETSEAKCRATNFLSSLDEMSAISITASTSYCPAERDEQDTQKLKFKDVTKMLGALELSSSVQTQKSKKTVSGWSYDTFKEKMHAQRQTLPTLYHSGPNTRLLVALKDDEDIEEVLVEREKDHAAKRLAWIEKLSKSEDTPGKKRRKLDDKTD